MLLSAAGAFATSVLALKLPAMDQLTLIYTAGGLAFPYIFGMVAPISIQAPVASNPMIMYPLASGVATYGAYMLYQKMK